MIDAGAVLPFAKRSWSKRQLHPTRVQEIDQQNTLLGKILFCDRFPFYQHLAFIFFFRLWLHFLIFHTPSCFEKQKNRPDSRFPLYLRKK